MSLDKKFQAIFFDMGGVILRTEDHSPRRLLGQKFGMTYEEIDSFVFNCEASKLASIGRIREDDLWLDVCKRLSIPVTEIPEFRNQFFAGDIIDLKIINFLRNARNQYRTGLISNAWSGLRAWVEAEKMDDAFDSLIFSAEHGTVKPKPEIYQIATNELGVLPQSVIFVDDMPDNIDTANRLGMTGILFTDQASLFSKLDELLKV